MYTLKLNFVYICVSDSKCRKGSLRLIKWLQILRLHRKKLRVSLLYWGHENLAGHFLQTIFLFMRQRAGFMLLLRKHFPEKKFVDLFHFPPMIQFTLICAAKFSLILGVLNKYTFPAFLFM
jgi:hypothetical protein